LGQKDVDEIKCFADVDGNISGLLALVCTPPKIGQVRYTPFEMVSASGKQLAQQYGKWMGRGCSPFVWVNMQVGIQARNGHHLELERRALVRNKSLCPPKSRLIQGC